MDGCELHATIGVADHRSDDAPCLGVVDARERPDRIAAQAGRPVLLQCPLQRRQRVLAAVGQLLHSPIAHRVARIVEQRNQLSRFQQRPRQLQATRVVDRAGVGLAHAVDRPLDFRLGDLGGRAADAEPTAGVDDDQAAIGILENVGRVEVLVVGGEEIFGLDFEARAGALENVPLNAMAIELGREEIVVICRAEQVRAIAHQAGRGDPAEILDRGQEFAGARQFPGRLVPGIVASLDGVDNAVVARRKVVQDIDGDEWLAFGGEGDFDRVVHAAAANDLDVAAIGFAAKDASRLALRDTAVRLANLVAMSSVAPVDASIGAEKGSMHVGGVTDEVELADQLDALVGDADILGIAHLPDMRGSRHVERAVVG